MGYSLHPFLPPERSGSEIHQIALQDFKNGNSDGFRTRLSHSDAVAGERARAEAFSASLKSLLSEAPDNTLIALRNNLAMGLTMNALLRMNNSGSYSMPEVFFDISEETLTDLRKAVIDEIKAR